MDEAEAAGLRFFFRIADRWNLTESEQLKILGLEAKPELDALRSNEAPQLAAGTLERVSYALGIYKAINTLLPIPERADNWMRATNNAPTFAGMTPAARMAGGTIADLQAVRRYLEAQLV
ncbi:MAG TPA: antitoxin Xre/MbcA/ParS toxin-binding domain-containing protein [Acetobacteraceae bacterium]|nr:antitoxin Xre/MbcA/ParS toxin-binding domain-containing protein [Acetobacteraceae bacterium]